MSAPTCCACPLAAPEIAYSSSHEIVQGLVYVGRGKWLCPTCTRTAVAAFARVASHGRTADIARDEPPPGFA